jgi:hypothetical protein
LFRRLRSIGPRCSKSSNKRRCRNDHDAHPTMYGRRAISNTREFSILERGTGPALFLIRSGQAQPNASP